MIRNIYFSGCSLTWGQSLHYHGNFDDDIHPRDGWYYEDKILPHHYQYQVDNRFATKVADYFCRKPIVAAMNGGHNWDISNHAKNATNDLFLDLIIIQTTAYSRSMEIGGYTIEDQQNNFIELIDISESKDIPIRFIHYGDLEESEVKDEILEKTIYINGQYSLWNLIHGNPKYTIGNTFNFSDDHLNMEGHIVISNHIIKNLETFLTKPKYE